VQVNGVPERPSPVRIELGCGDHKRPGFFGIDISGGREVDLVHDIEKDPLPFPSDSVDHVYSSHTFEHLEKAGSPIFTLREIVRVARHGATVEIWTPYGKSNDGLLLGHRNFYTEQHWQHICVLYDDFYLGAGIPGRFLWEKTQYVLNWGAMEELAEQGIPIELALKYMYNVALEFGVFLKVDKTLTRAPNPQIPAREYCYQRGDLLTPVAVSRVSHAFIPPPPSVPGESAAEDLRVVLSRELRLRFPTLHSLAKAARGLLK